MSHLTLLYAWRHCIEWTFNGSDCYKELTLIMKMMDRQFTAWNLA